MTFEEYLATDHEAQVLFEHVQHEANRYCTGGLSANEHIESLMIRALIYVDLGKYLLEALHRYHTFELNRELSEIKGVEGERGLSKELSDRRAEVQNLLDDLKRKRRIEVERTIGSGEAGRLDILHGKGKWPQPVAAVDPEKEAKDERDLEEFVAELDREI